MSDAEEAEPEKPFHVDRAKTGRAGCKKCKQKIASGELRLAKLGYNPFGSGTMKIWHHVPCLFEAFKRQRATTKKIETCLDIGGWNDISLEDQEEIKKYLTPNILKDFDVEPAATNSKKDKADSSPQKSDESVKASSSSDDHRDNSFREFRRLLVDLTNESSYTNKTNLLKQLFTKGSDGQGFKGDVEQWCRLLLPGAVKRVYNLQSKQLVKIFSRIFKMNQDEMLEDLEKGDVAETVGNFFEKNKKIRPCKKATLSLQRVDSFLEYLSKLTKEEDQIDHFTQITQLCTVNDLKVIIRLVKHDLRINAGPKHILEAVHDDAYQAFQTTRDIKSVIKEALSVSKESPGTKSPTKGMKKELKIMTSVLPMLAQPCKSVQMAMKKCPNGMFSEIKYDGERVQLHKAGNTFKYFSRSLKPVLPHKVNHFEKYIPRAFPHAEDLILDSEILMVDIQTGKPLPFGTLGKHKKSEFTDASVCLFVFDCIYYNGESLINKPIRVRKDILNKNMVEIKNHIMFAETEEIHSIPDLEKMMTKVFKLGLEGLILKDLNSIYEPGKRHWLKVKKDYLKDGAMADSADLVVLGGWFGTGKKGGIMSSFLMGCYDPEKDRWVTVTKVSSGHDDKTLGMLQDELNVIKISKDPSKVPTWLKCTKTMIPDFVAQDPKEMPVWEIRGAEFTCNQVHTANGISVRFPRVIKIREDKDWKTATNLDELKILYEKSKDTSNFSLGSPSSEQDADDQQMSKSKRKAEKRKNDAKEESKKKIKCDATVQPKSSKVSSDQEDDYGSETETDGENEETNGSKQLVLKNPLPDIFQNTVIELPSSLKDYEFLRRYIIAYGGVLYNTQKNLKLENSHKQVTHVVHKKEKFEDSVDNSHWSKDVKHVVIGWLWDSIKLLERQKEHKYTVHC